MNKTKNRIAIILVSIFLGLILSIQFKTIEGSQAHGALPTQRAQDLANELKKVQADKEAFQNRIEELEEKIEQYELEGVSNDAYAENLYNDAMRYRMLAGYVDLEGPGIILEINDPTNDVNFSQGYYSIVDELELVLQIISILNAADAEAISINDQRYTSFTEIVRAGEHIEINGVSNNSPITIKAIGNPDILESALAIKRGIVWQLRNYNYIVNLSTEENVNIPRYKNVEEFNYSTPSEEGNK